MIQEVRLPTWNLAVTMSYPLGNSAQEANYARSKVQYQQSLAQVRSLELRVATDITNGALTVNNNLEQVQASGASRELAQKKLEAAQSKFEVGMSTNYEVVQAQRDLNDAVDRGTAGDPQLPEVARRLPAAAGDLVERHAAACRPGPAARTGGSGSGS